MSNNYEVHNYKTKYDPEYGMEYCDYEDGERPLGLIRESDTVKIVGIRYSFQEPWNDSIATVARIGNNRGIMIL